MKELTFKKKIEFCDAYLSLTVFGFICNFFRTWQFGTPGNLKEQEIQVMFPELYTMIMKVGESLDRGHIYGMAWWPQGYSTENWSTFDGGVKKRKFRNERIKELKIQLENKNLAK